MEYWRRVYVQFRSYLQEHRPSVCQCCLFCHLFFFSFSFLFIFQHFQNATLIGKMYLCATTIIKIYFTVPVDLVMDCYSTHY